MSHFATLITEDHVPGALALGQSLYENGGYGEKTHIHILLPKEITTSSRKKISNLPISVDFYGPNWLVEYDCPNEYIPNDKTINQYKFNVFRLPVKKLTYVDADALCLSNITEIESMKELSVVADFGKDGYSVINNRVEFNSGMFVCEPCNSMFQKLQDFGREWEQTITKGDQPIMNQFFLSHYPERVDYLSPGWNTLQPWRIDNRRLWRSVLKEGIKFLHYTHVKPWFNYWPSDKDESYFIWNKWYKKYILYRKLQKIWKPYYDRAVQ